MSDLSKELKHEYHLRFSQMAEYRNEVWKILTKNFFQNQIGLHKTVLDLGSGWGEFINNIQAKKKYAMDLNEESASKLSEEVRFLYQDCSKDWKLDDGSLDIVFTSNFFEHLREKPSLDRTLDQAMRCLAPHGKIICLGPNIKYVGNDYWDFYDHYLALSHLSLEEALRLRGFEIDKSIPKFLPYTMVNSKHPPLIFLMIYLKLKIAWRFFGKQFLVVARKPK